LVGHDVHWLLSGPLQLAHDASHVLQVGLDRPSDPPHWPLRYVCAPQLLVQSRHVLSVVPEHTPLRYLSAEHDVVQLRHWRFEPNEQPTVSNCSLPHCAQLVHTRGDAAVHRPAAYCSLGHDVGHDTHVGLLVGVQLPLRYWLLPHDAVHAPQAPAPSTALKKSLLQVVHTKSVPLAHVPPSSVPGGQLLRHAWHTTSDTAVGAAIWNVAPLVHEPQVWHTVLLVEVQAVTANLPLGQVEQAVQRPVLASPYWLAGQAVAATHCDPVRKVPAGHEVHSWFDGPVQVAQRELQDSQ